MVQTFCKIIVVMIPPTGFEHLDIITILSRKEWELGVLKVLSYDNELRHPYGIPKACRCQ